MAYKGKRLGRLRISYKFIHDLLSLPKEAEIVRLYDLENKTDIFDIYVSSPYLPEGTAGGEIPIVTMNQLSGYDE